MPEHLVSRILNAQKNKINGKFIKSQTKLEPPSLYYKQAMPLSCCLSLFNKVFHIVHNDVKKLF